MQQSRWENEYSPVLGNLNNVALTSIPADPLSNIVCSLEVAT